MQGYSRKVKFTTTFTPFKFGYDAVKSIFLVEKSILTFIVLFYIIESIISMQESA